MGAVYATSLELAIFFWNHVLCKDFLEIGIYAGGVPTWSLLTGHARALVCIAHDPAVRLRDIAAALDITERSAYGFVTDLASAGYIVKERYGRRNRYQIQHHQPFEDSVAARTTIGEILELLVDAGEPPSEAH